MPSDVNFFNVVVKISPSHVKGNNWCPASGVLSTSANEAAPVSCSPTPAKEAPPVECSPTSATAVECAPLQQLSQASEGALGSQSLNFHFTAKSDRILFVLHFSAFGCYWEGKNSRLLWAESEWNWFSGVDWILWRRKNLKILFVAFAPHGIFSDHKFLRSLPSDALLHVEEYKLSSRVNVVNETLWWRSQTTTWTLSNGYGGILAVLQSSCNSTVSQK